MQVSRTTVRAALRQLAGEGLLKSAGTRGLIVAETLRSETQALLAGTVIVLSEPGDIPKPVQGHAAGLESVIQMGVIDRLNGSATHALCLNCQEISTAQIQRLIEERPKGMIALRHAIQTRAGQAILNQFRRDGIRVVAYGDVPEVRDDDTLVSDHEAGSYELTRWLIETGKTRILRYWQMPQTDARTPEWLARRDAGHERAMRQAGLEPIPALLAPSLPKQPRDAGEFAMWSQLAAGQLLGHLGPGASRPEAIMCISDSVVPPAAAACRMLGVEPNRDVALVGYDHSWADLRFGEWEPTAPLATVDKDNYAIGRMLAELLLDRVTGKLPPEPQHRLAAPRLVVGVS